MIVPVDLRPPRPADAAVVARLINDATGDWCAWPRTTEADVQRFWRPHGDRHAVVALVDGEIVGYGRLHTTDPARRRLTLDVLTRPSRAGRAVGRRLVDALDRRLAQRAALVGADLVLRTHIESSQIDVGTVLAEAGFRPVRHPVRLLAPVDAPPPEPAWPAGIRIRTFEPGDERAIHDLHVATLADSFDYELPTYESWVDITMRTSTFDPRLWFVAEANGTVVGIALTHISEVDPTLGWIDMLGVRRDWRSRRLGAALLRLVFGEFHRRGLRGVGGGTEADTPTGGRWRARLDAAPRLGRNAGTAGFRVVQAFVTYEKKYPRPHAARTLLVRSSHRLGRALAGLRLQ